MRKVLVYNNQTGLAEKMEPLFAGEGLQTAAASDTEELGMLLNDKEVLLMLVDVELGGKGWDKGIEMIANLRKASSIPLIVVSKQSLETAKIMALEAGADDYVVKPFKLGELGARVEAHLRRESRGDSGLSAKFFDNLTINFNKRQVSYQDKVIPFTKKEFDIVELLTRNPGQVFDKERIYELIWGYDGDGNSSIIVEHIRRIRKKFMEYTERNFIETVWGIGYKWEN